MQIILNSWDISRGTHVYPRRKRISLDDFLLDKWLRSEIDFLFGNHVIMYIDRLANKDRSIFCLSEKIVRKIIDYLAVKDILHLKQSSKIFFEVCTIFFSHSFKFKLTVKIFYRWFINDFLLNRYVDICAKNPIFISSQSNQLKIK